MRLTIHPDARAFLGAATPTLGAREAEHHLVLGVAESVAAPAVTPNAAMFAATVADERGLVLAALMSARETPLLLASDRDGVGPAAALVVNALAEAGRQPRRVIGAVPHAEAFVEEWARRSGRRATVAMRQRAYKLAAVEPVPAVPGTLRAATVADLELVTAWVTAFELEALGPALGSHAPRAMAERRIAAGEVYLWVDPEPRAMAGSARPTAHGIAVNAVYTPPEWRRRGYATACVAELSARLLAAGREFCVLYTDLANPTSNAIYTRMGYRPVRDFLMYELGAT